MDRKVLRARMDRRGANAPRISRNFPSALAHESFMTSAFKEMLAAGAISILPEGERPEVVRPLGVVPKGSKGKFRLVINMRYVNDHLVKKKFKLEGFKDLADLAEKEDHVVSFDLTSVPGIILWSCTLAIEPTPGLSGRIVITFVSAYPLGSLRPP